jgi:hypothetical protein
MELMDSDLGEAVSRGSPVLPPAAASAVPLIDDESDAARPTKRAKHARSGSKGRALSSKPPREKSPLIRPISALHILQGRSPSPRPMHGRSLSPHNHAHGPQMMKKSPAALTLPHPAAASASSFLLPSAAMHSHAHSSHSHSHPAAHAAGSHANVPPAYPIKMTKAFRAPPRNALEAERMKLPIFQAKDEILTAVQQNDNIIVIGETGSGSFEMTERGQVCWAVCSAYLPALCRSVFLFSKTTQIPQYLLSSGLVGRGQIACTQPRRVAAISVAQRVAQEYGCTVGQQVGYSIRFELVTSPATRIKYITDGMLLREIMADPLLQDYNAIVLDEAHERTVRTRIVVMDLHSYPMPLCRSRHLS